jgi:hypothetical protein
MLINVNTQLNNYFKPFILVARGAGRAKGTRGTRGAGRAKGSLRRSNRISGRSEKELEEVEKEDEEDEEDEEEEEEEVLISSTQQSTQQSQTSQSSSTQQSQLSEIIDRGEPVNISMQSQLFKSTQRSTRNIEENSENITRSQRFTPAIETDTRSQHSTPTDMQPQ